MGLQPALQRWREGKGGLDGSPLATATQQPGPLGSLGTTEKGIESIKKDGFARARFTGEHSETGPERKLQGFDQSNVLQAKPCQHWRSLKSVGEP